MNTQMETPEEKRSALIQHNLEGQASEEEQAEFQALLVNSAAFRNEVEAHKQGYRQMAAIVQHERREAFKQKFGEDAASSASPVRVWLLAAAILLPLILAAGWFWWGQPRTPGLEPFNQESVWRGRQGRVQDFSTQQGVRQLMDQGAYAEALASLTIPEATDTAAYMQSLDLRSGIYFLMGKYEAGARDLEMILLLEQDLATLAVMHWDLARAYLQTEDWKKARPHLTWLLEEQKINEYKKVEAREWLDYINQQMA